MFGDLGKIMKIAGQMKTKLPEIQERLANTDFTAEAGGGVVSATVNGKLALVGVRIDPQVLADGRADAAMLEDLLKAAVAAAQQKAAEAAAEAMNEVTGGLDLGGLGGMLGV